MLICGNFLNIITSQRQFFVKLRFHILSQTDSFNQSVFGNDRTVGSCDFFSSVQSEFYVLCIIFTVNTVFLRGFKILFQSNIYLLVIVLKGRTCVGYGYFLSFVFESDKGFAVLKDVSIRSFDFNNSVCSEIQFL